MMPSMMVLIVTDHGLPYQIVSGMVMNEYARMPAEIRIGSQSIGRVTIQTSSATLVDNTPRQNAVAGRGRPAVQIQPRPVETRIQTTSGSDKTRIPHGKKIKNTPAAGDAAATM